ncbi:MAG: tRNA (N(6)-L-threonylcarbamoyladenosine(37)-C(2))-methylthiotransferase MtaB [Candidatus Omnitrophica bacterium]|nr:tRNA (N(6)-L-threonylcarbamoyladenosine(37)-C(2))-methylthiotransferase MtaB [Candidatus Omnitrophota bacterium]
MKVTFKTLGCKVNQYETQLMREQFTASGFKEPARDEQPDVYVINTCTVTQKADSESRRLIRKARRENPDAKIIVAGCYAELDRAEIAKISKDLIIIKNSEKTKILQYLDGCQAPNHIKVSDTSIQGISGFEGRTKAFVKVQDGCDNFCSYCKVPYARGRSRSRKIDDIVPEISRLVSSGYREIILTGICLGDWGRSSGLTITDLLKAVDPGVTGTFRIRLSSIEPWYVTEALLRTMASLKRVCKHLHIPMQSGDNDVLKKMNRKFSSTDFAALIGRCRSFMPDIAFTTDIMVGFPGETEDEFQNTLNITETTAPSRTHIFPYSPRKGTKAHEAGGFISAGEMRKRVKRLKLLTDKLASMYRQKFTGQRLEVLVETERDKASGLLVGYTDTYVPVAFDGPDELRGTLREVVLTNENSYDILATRFDGTGEAIGGVYPQDKLDRCINRNCFSQK